MAAKNTTLTDLQALVSSIQEARDDLRSVLERIKTVEEKLVEVRKASDEIMALLVKGPGRPMLSRLDVQETQLVTIRDEAQGLRERMAKAEDKVQGLDNFRARLLGIATVVAFLSSLFGALIVKLLAH